MGPVGRNAHTFRARLARSVLIVVYFPYGVGQFLRWERGHPSLLISISGVPVHVLPAGGVLTWIASTAYGVFFAKSEKTGTFSPDAAFSKKLLIIAAKVTPYVFILGLLLGLSLLASFLANWVKHLNRSAFDVPSSLHF